MGTEVLSVDTLKLSAYGDNSLSFDVQDRVPVTADLIVHDEAYDPDISMKKKPSKVWELDVRPLISSKKWLMNYGLKRNRLDLYHILPQIGFKHAEDFDPALKKPVSSRYGEGMFKRYFRPDGKVFNISCSKEKVKQIENRLVQAILLYKRRLQWLTSESRRLFGVIQEHCVSIVLDIKNMSPQQFDQYRAAVERVLKEQVSQCGKFNLIRAAEDMVMYSHSCVPVTSESIDSAIEWLWGLDRLASVSRTATTEAVVRAMEDINIECVYLFSEGSAAEGTRELLKEKLIGAKLPLHVVSYNCSNPETMQLLRALSKITGGRFHAYAVVMEMDSYEGLPPDPLTHRANIVLKKKAYGGIPAGAGCREDVIFLFEELEEARNTLQQVQALLLEVPDPRQICDNPPDRFSFDQSSSSDSSSRPEQYMGSKEWLDRNGMNSKRLGFFDILGGVAFKHCDGVIDLKEAPTDEDMQTDAVLKSKLVNAKYCNKFAHVRWKDGQVVHVQVTPEIHRQYEQRMTVFLSKMNSRIDWLQQGSRALFGTVIEDDIIFLIDTSSSMEPSIQFVKDKIYTLMQEQLRHKQKFNIVSFNSRVCPWRDRMVDVNEANLQAAWQWVKSLSCTGSTNTLGALRFALADHAVQAIYLLTDGRPDQPPKTVLAQVNLKNHIPIHAISFNCADAEANKFLCQLAKDTTGRYHYFSEHGSDPEGPEPWESEDIRLLKEEAHLAESNLDKIAQLRDECTALAWKREVTKKCSRDHILSHRDRISAVPPLSTTELYRSDSDRPQSASGMRSQPTPRSQRPISAVGFHSAPHAGHRQKIVPHRSMTTPRPLHMKRGHKNPLSASHTRTSLLRTLSSAGKFEDTEWLLPETKDLFEKQWERQKKLAEDLEKKEKIQVKKKKKMTDPLAMSSRQWLKKYGLSAKKLTILDALAPTIIPHNPKYVPILDKYVLSKVFDEVLPVAHMSHDKKAVKLVNPKAVDLIEYERKLTKAVTSIRKHLNTILWNCLPKSEQDEFECVPDFQEHKQQMFAALDRAGWPIKESDITLLEDEINQGTKYLEQSRALRSANPDLQSGEVEDNISLSDSGDDLEKVDEGKEEADEEKEVDESERKSGEGSDGEVSLLPTPTPSPKSPSPRLKSPSPEPEKEKSTPFEFEGLGEVMEKKTPRTSVSGPAVSKTKVKKVLDTLKGQSVIARNTKDGLYYPGTVIKCTDSRHALVKFTEIGQKTVPTRFVIPTGGAVARPVLRVGDYVLLRVMNYETKYDCYVPGIIRNTPMKETNQMKFYTVMIYSDQKASALRSHLVKISKARFTFAVRYLKDVQELESPNIEITPRHSDSEDDDTSYADARSEDREIAKITNGDTNGETNGDAPPPAESPEHTKPEFVQTQEKRLDELQHQLELQQREQARQQKMLRKETKRLARAQEKMAEQHMKQQKQTESRLLEEQQKMLKKQDEIYEQTKSLIESSKRGSTTLDFNERVQTWITNDPGEESTLSAGRTVTDTESPRKKSNSAWDPNSSSGLLKKLRAQKPKLRVGEEVLSRWADEGWYYRGTVRQVGDEGAYFIEDSCGDIEKIFREDIITDEDDADNIIQVKDAVIALHPDFAYSYCPGVVMKVYPDLWLLIRFYDGEEARLPRDEVYRIPPEKFEYDVSFIMQREDQWVGQAVVARDDSTGIYHLSSVTERVGNGRQYVISWADGKLAVQTSSAIFGAFTKRRPLAIGDHVLAIVDAVRLAYLPGTIRDVSQRQLVVKFCDGSKQSDIDATQVFWLSQDYYEHAVAYYYSKSNGEEPRHSMSDSSYRSGK